MENIHKVTAFKIFFIFLIISCTITIICGLVVFQNYLTDYQANQPINAIYEYFNRLEKGDYKLAIELSGFKEDDFNSKDDFIKYINNKFSSKFSELEYIKTNYEAKLQDYDVYLGNDKKGSLIIEKNGQKSEFGFDIWKVTKIDNLIYIPNITVSAPKNAKIFINGKPLPQKYRTNINLIKEYPAVSTGFERPSIYTYKLSPLLLVPEITAETPNGDKCDKTVNIDGDVLFIWPKLKQKQLEALVKEATINYTYVITQAKDTDIFLKYLLIDTPYYKTIENYNSSWYIQQPEISGDKLENFKVTDYIEYDEIHASMNVSFDYTIYTTNGNEETKFPFSYTIYYIFKSEKWQIVEMIIS